MHHPSAATGTFKIIELIVPQNYIMFDLQKYKVVVFMFPYAILFNNDVRYVCNIFSELGLVELSFEYNRKKETFKIRVWQLCNLVLPPGMHVL